MSKTKQLLEKYLPEADGDMRQKVKQAITDYVKPLGVRRVRLRKQKRGGQVEYEAQLRLGADVRGIEQELRQISGVEDVEVSVQGPDASLVVVKV